jgi:hypothetical protein
VKGRGKEESNVPAREARVGNGPFTGSGSLAAHTEPSLEKQVPHTPKHPSQALDQPSHHHLQPATKMKTTPMQEDLSAGQARYPVPVINQVDDEGIFDWFIYSEGYVFPSQTPEPPKGGGCSCKPGQCRGEECECVARSTIQLHWVGTLLGLHA